MTNVPSSAFWKDYQRAARVNFGTPVFFNATEEFGRGVWPSFFDNTLKNNTAEVRRRKFQIVHIDNGKHVSLFVKGVHPRKFAAAVTPVLDEGMTISDGIAWQAVQLQTMPLDYALSVSDQLPILRSVCDAARTLLDFTLKHESTLLAVPLRGDA